MPAPAPFPPAHPSAVPALYLYPLNDTFVPKHIALLNGQHVKIGRQTNNKTIPGERNGYFDSKVLSRQHAEVWEESGKIYIKDVKSSNGTFINGERLSQEGLESEPFELKTADIVEFGIDIVGEDNKTIVHHKVAARVTCILTPEEAAAASHDVYQFQQQSQQVNTNPGGTLNGNGQRRPTLQPQTNGLGGMGGGMRQPGKSGLTFDHILSRLQGELQKSRETGAELGVVASAMGEIGDVMNGGQPGNLPSYPHVLPPVRAPPQHPPPQSEPESSSGALHILQTQLAETQASLSNHVEKIRALESLLSEHEGIKREVASLRDLIEERERQRVSERDRHHLHHQQVDDDDDDDAHSVHTITSHELESVPEEDEAEAEAEMEESDEEIHARREELGRPRTPEPSSLGMVNSDYDDHDRSHPREREHEEEADSHLAVPQPTVIPDELSRRLSILSDQLESALELSRTLQAQHTAAQQTIEHLEGKVTALEELVRASQSAKEAEDARAAEREEQREKDRQISMTAMMAEFKKTIEARWDSVKEDWEFERQKSSRAREEWDVRAKLAEENITASVGKVELGLTSIASHLSTMKAANRHLKEGKRKSGLATPPSPRSLSSDSDRPPRRKRVQSRGRSRSRSPASTLVNSEGPNGTSSYHPSERSRSSSPANGTAGLSDSESRPKPNGIHPTTQYPLTPESSLLETITKDNVTPAEMKTQQAQSVNNAQMAVGVLVLGVAAAAVLWRVKE